MAIEVAFKADVDLGEGAKSLKSLKQDFKEAQKELDGLTVGSEKYIKTLTKLGGIKDDIGDLNDEIAAFNPEGKIKAFGNVIGGVASGFQAATGAAALFGSGNQELEKTLVKLQAVMAFTDGIRGVTSLGDGFKSLSNTMKLTVVGQKVVTAAQWLWNAALNANPIGLLVIGLTALIASMKLFASSTEDAAAKQERLNNLQKESEERINKYSDSIKKRLQISVDAGERELALMKAQGATADEIFKKEQDIARQKQYILSYVNGFRGALTEEEKKQQLDLINQTKINDAEYLKHKKGVADSEEELIKKKNNNIRKEQLDAHLKYVDEQADLINAEADAYDAMIKNQKAAVVKAGEDSTAQAEIDALSMLGVANREILARAELKTIQNKGDLLSQIDFLETKKNIELQNSELTESERIIISEKYKQQEVELTKKYKLLEVSESLAIAQQSTQALQGLSDLFFAVKKANLKKGSAEELKAAKQQFKINKGLSIASTIISGLQGVVNGLTAPYPQNIILPVLAGITTAASVAKIAGTQFESGTAPSAPTIPTIDASGAAARAPTINPPGSSTTALNPDGTVRNPNPQSFVIQNNISETEMTNKQKRVATIELNAQIG